MAKNVLVDIDGTVCEDISNENSHLFSSAQVMPGAVEGIAKLSQNHTITFFTARTEDHRAVTTAWLDKHGFIYKGVIFNKPRSRGHPGGYVWIDNINVQGVTFKTWDNVQV